MSNRSRQEDKTFTEAELRDLHSALCLLKDVAVDVERCPLLAAYAARAIQYTELPTLPDDEREAFVNDIEKLRIRVWRMLRDAEERK